MCHKHTSKHKMQLWEQKILPYFSLTNGPNSTPVEPRLSCSEKHGDSIPRDQTKIRCYPYPKDLTRPWRLCLKSTRTEILHLLISTARHSHTSLTNAYIFLPNQSKLQPRPTLLDRPAADDNGLLCGDFNAHHTL